VFSWGLVRDWDLGVSLVVVSECVIVSAPDAGFGHVRLWCGCYFGEGEPARASKCGLSFSLSCCALYNCMLACVVC
jgi:hypothetical protein